ncbi:MAG TPA: thioredoxin-dependent thiol peroxidase [Bacteroidota bacterium]|nr:thioredoxin-dependent thiol peroxidase [Bacteroidota bacterium]
MMPEEGAEAPDFSLPDGSGKTVSLKDFKGKKAVIYFYPKDDTPGCTTEACDFRDNLARIRKTGAEVVGVSADPVKSHAKFAGKYGLPFPLLSDEEGAMLKAYGVWQKKSFMGRTYMGIVRSTFILDEQGVIVKVFPTVKVPGHVDEVLEVLTK